MAEPGAYDFEPEYTVEELTAIANLHASIDLEIEVDGSNIAESSTGRPVGSWCVCNNCQVMATERECLCCQAVPALQGLISSGESCVISNNPDFYAVCLNHAVLRANYASLRSQRHGDDIDALPPQLSNR